MKNVLPWILLLGVCGVAVSLTVSNHNKENELTQLREQAHQAQTAQAEVEQLRTQVQAQDNQLATLRQDNQELLRLRNQVRQLQDESKNLSRQAQTAQAEAQRAQSQMAEVQNSERQLRQIHAETSQRNECINNLRQIDAAMQQWALEHNKGADAVPAAQDIAPYFPQNQMPVCPAGGRYTLGAVSNAPTCSIAGHALQ